MIFLPFGKFLIETSLSRDEVASQLHYNIEKDKINKHLNGVKPRHFEGQLTYDSVNERYMFELYRISHLRFISIPPGMQGTVTAAEGKTRIEVRMELNFLHVLNLTILFGLILLSIIGQALSGDFSPFPVIVFILGFGAFSFDYFPEVRVNKDLLLDITKGKAVGKLKHTIT